MVKHFRELIVWQKSHDFVKDVYKLTCGFPSNEKFGIVSQLRRAAVSIPTNIVEGFKRKSKKDNANFINVAASSLEETKYLILLAKDLEYLDDDNYTRLYEQSDEIGKMLHSIYKYLHQ